MKKILSVFVIILALVGADIASAQESYPVFSAALGSGGSYREGARRTSMYRPNGGRTAAPVRQKQVRRKKTIVKYTPDQVVLTEQQLSKLMPMIKRIQDGKVKSLEVVGISKEEAASLNRQDRLGRMLEGYAPNFIPEYRTISGHAVLSANDHTMEFIEYY